MNAESRPKAAPEQHTSSIAQRPDGPTFEGRRRPEFTWREDCGVYVDRHGGLHVDDATFAEWERQSAPARHPAPARRRAPRREVRLALVTAERDELLVERDELRHSVRRHRRAIGWLRADLAAADELILTLVTEVSGIPAAVAA